MRAFVHPHGDRFFTVRAWLELKLGLGGVAVTAGANFLARLENELAVGADGEAAVRAFPGRTFEFGAAIATGKQINNLQAGGQRLHHAGAPPLFDGEFGAAVGAGFIKRLHGRLAIGAL